MALFGRKAHEPQDPPVVAELDGSGVGRTKKDRPTPTRKEAEAARRERVNKTLTKKEARRKSARHSRVQRTRAMTARDAGQEKALMRDYVDARFSLGEFLLPSLVIILALTFLSSVYPPAMAIGTLVMYLFILLVMVDIAFMWRGFKEVLRERHPQASTRGLLMYGMNRAIQIRRFRMPKPRLSRGDAY